MKKAVHAGIRIKMRPSSHRLEQKQNHQKLDNVIAKGYERYTERRIFLQVRIVAVKLIFTVRSGVHPCALMKNNESVKNPKSVILCTLLTVLYLVIFYKLHSFVVWHHCMQRNYVLTYVSIDENV